MDIWIVLEILNADEGLEHYTTAHLTKKGARKSGLPRPNSLCGAHLAQKRESAKNRPCTCQKTLRKLMVPEPLVF